MRKLLILTFLGLSAFVSAGVAQNRCPAGFRFAGRLHGEGSFGSNFNQRAEVTFAPSPRIDKTYQQDSVHAENGQSDAHTNLRPENIPHGIRIVPFGSDDHEKGWAVLEPELKGVEFDDEDRVTRYAFGMHLYCTTGSGEADRFVGGCDVNVDVCYKPK